MTDSSAVAAHPVLVSNSGNWPWRIAIVAMLTALADWLFFRQHVGVSLVLFMLALGVAVLLINRDGADVRERIIYAGVLIAALLPCLEDINVMSVLIAMFGIGCFALGVSAAFKGGVIERFMTVMWLLLTGPLQIARDLPLLRQWASDRGAPASLTALKGWIVPLGLGVVFVALLASANPVIAHWLAQWSAGDTPKFDTARVILWGFVVVAVWGLVGVSGRFAIPRFDEPAKAPSPDADLIPTFSKAVTARSTGDGLGPIFTDAAILRWLVLFNLLFAIQTVMDIHYLWRGAALPDGMTYATYAHRGAYPLMVTALLAAAFVLVAMRPGSNAERSPLMRALVFLWIGQNVLLVASAIMRLDLYVETYLLTYWRVAAFIWMAVVAIGLILIVARIVTGRSNAWLIAANLVVLMLTIYVCSFVNFASLVATYNVAAGRPVDLPYVVSLGSEVIPALDHHFAANPTSPNLAYFRDYRGALARRHDTATADWRAWTFRGWRLSHYLENTKQP